MYFSIIFSLFLYLYKADLLPTFLYYFKFKDFSIDADRDFEEKYNSLTDEEKKLFGKYVQAMFNKLQREVKKSQKTAYSAIKDALDDISSDLPSSPNNNPEDTGKSNTNKK